MNIMKTASIITGFALILTMFFPVSSYCCTTFCFQADSGGGWIFGRNYDWETGNCLLMVNQRGVVKTALSPNNPAKWVSKYGSITFNQYGREFPLGGMNEAGLVIECMWLRPARYPAPDSRPEVSELQWMQYQLDECATVKEVIATDKILRIEAKESAPLHFLVCDNKGGVAVIEFLDGKMKAYTGENLPYSALANSTYKRSKSFVQNLNEKTAGHSFQEASYSLKRFMWAALGAKEWLPNGTAKAVDYAFKLLDRVTVSRTMFAVVYDIENQRIYYRTKENADIRFVEMKAFDFNCSGPVKILDITKAGKVSGKVNMTDMTGAFSNYTYDANFRLVKKSWQETPFLKSRPISAVRIRASYPGTLKCK